MHGKVLVTDGQLARLPFWLTERQHVRQSLVTEGKELKGGMEVPPSR